ncbi:hypothetical protein ACOSP7_033089 [Xanthoceras sorbifolium]
MQAAGKNSITVVITNIFIAWIPPPAGWIKLNVDKSKNCDLGFIFAGGVLCDANKLWLGGFAVNRG